MGTEQCSTVSEHNEHTSVPDQNNSVDTTVNGFVCDPSVNSQSKEVSKPTQDGPYIYRQDVVRHNESGMIGVVTEVAVDSDLDGNITDNDGDEADDKGGENEEGFGDDSSNANKNGDGNRDGRGCKSGSLTKDQVLVFWMNDTESVQTLNDIRVLDRAFLHGDFVAAASEPTGQVGVVLDVNVTVDLLAPDGSMFRDVSSKDLKRVRDFTVGDYVVLGPWLGRIQDVLDNLTVLFDDGSACRVTKVDFSLLKPILQNLLEDGHFPYYPGQRVRASSSLVFKNSRWLSGSWKPNRFEGTVTKVTVGSVFIYWIASAGYGPDCATAPAEEQSPKNIKLLSCFTHTNWQLGDRCLLPSLAPSSSIPLDKDLSKLKIHDSSTSKLEPGNGFESEEVAQEELSGNGESMDFDQVEASDGNIGTSASPEPSSCRGSLSVSKEPIHESWPLHRKKIRKVSFRRDKKTHKIEESFEGALLIVNTRSVVDVAWQDGTRKLGLDSTALVPIDTPGDHEFVSEQYVVEKASEEDDDAFEIKRVGVVRSVNAKERTALVRWLKPVSRSEDPREFEKEEIVSVYEIEGHPDYDYCYGDIVVRLTPVFGQFVSGGDSVNDPAQENGSIEAPSDMKKHPESEKNKDASGGGACLDYSDLSWVGNITGLKDGDIEVTWADGMVSTVGPQAIYVVGRNDEDDSVGAGSEISDDAASWETINDDADEMDILEDSREELELQNATETNSDAEEDEANNSGRSTPRSLPLAALGFVTRFATGIFSRGHKHMDSIAENDDESHRKIQSFKEDDDESSSQKSNVTDHSGAEVAAESPDLVDATGAFCHIETEKLTDSTSSEDATCSFKQFDIAKDPLDHYFLGAHGQSNNGRKWLKKVNQDWSILQNNLPDGIYVRAYEDRMDLLRAVIVGAYGTPYQDGLFFFDFHLPPEYPNVPPSAYYHSGGWRVNPNLYEEGKVCLSLLNTWTGKGNEVWDPSSSSILQVLVSLQGLVLNSKPYFNEAGYDKQVGTAEGEKNSLSYNENTFLLNCKTMIYLKRKPPKDFEELIREHFRKRGYYILKACDAYKKGYLIGSLTKDASVSDEKTANSTSVGFKLMLAKIVPKLFLALNEVGADCNEFKHLQQS